jgi:hypothetical protein
MKKERSNIQINDLKHRKKINIRRLMKSRNGCSKNTSLRKINYLICAYLEKTGEEDSITTHWKKNGPKKLTGPISHSRNQNYSY